MSDDPIGLAYVFFIPQVADWISANDRLHWAKKARLTKTWRDAGLVYARRERLPRLDRAEIRVHVHKTTARKYDAMNLYPSMKALVDGMTTDYGLLPDDDNDHLEGPFIYAGEKQSRPGLTVSVRPLNPRT